MRKSTPCTLNHDGHRSMMRCSRCLFIATTPRSRGPLRKRLPGGKCPDELIHVLGHQQCPSEPAVRPWVGQIDHAQGTSSILIGRELDIEVHTGLQGLHRAAEPGDRRRGLHIQQAGFHSGFQYMVIACRRWQRKSASGVAQAPWPLDSSPPSMRMRSTNSGPSSGIAVSGNSTRCTAQQIQPFRRSGSSTMYIS